MRKLLLVALAISASASAQMPNFRENVPVQSKPIEKKLVKVTIEDVAPAKTPAIKGLVGIESAVDLKTKDVYFLSGITKAEADKVAGVKTEEVTVDVTEPIYYNYFKARKKLLESQIKSKVKESKGKTISEVTAINDKIKKLQAELTECTTTLDDIAKTDDFDLFFPTFDSRKKERFFESIYGKDKNSALATISGAEVQFNDEGSTVQSELASAYLQAIRICFGTSITNTKEDEDAEATERALDDADQSNEAFRQLLTNGGNVYITGELPVFYFQSSWFTSYLTSNAKFASTISEFSDNVDTSTANGSLGSGLYLAASTDDRKFTFFANGTFNWYMGGDAFFERLQIADKKSFGFGQVTVGFTVLNRLRFALTTNTFSSEENLRSGKVIFGVQVLSGLFE